MTITATLYGPDGRTATLDRRAGNARAYAGSAGKVYQIALPPSLTAGRYRHRRRERAGPHHRRARNHLLGPGAVGVSRRDDVPFTAMAVTGTVRTGAGPAVIRFGMAAEIGAPVGWR